MIGDKNNNLSTSLTTKKVGQLYETLAQQYLIDNGLHFIDKNFHNRGGEIDLIMKDHDIFVFVEVKYRQQSHFGGAINAIPYSKQQKIRQCAKFYLQHAKLNEYNTACRFDVVALQGSVASLQHEKLNITWLKNAF